MRQHIRLTQFDDYRIDLFARDKEEGNQNSVKKLMESNTK